MRETYQQGRRAKRKRRRVKEVGVLLLYAYLKIPFTDLWHLIWFVGYPINMVLEHIFIISKVI